MTKEDTENEENPLDQELSLDDMDDDDDDDLISSFEDSLDDDDLDDNSKFDVTVKRSSPPSLAKKRHV